MSEEDGGGARANRRFTFRKFPAKAAVPDGPSLRELRESQRNSDLQDQHRYITSLRAGVFDLIVNSELALARNEIEAEIDGMQGERQQNLSNAAIDRYLRRFLRVGHLGPD